MNLYIGVYIILCISFLQGANQCVVPKNIHPYVKTQGLSNVKLTDADLKNNFNKLCIFKLHIPDTNFLWNMTLVYHPRHQKGPFWFLPHDNEDTAFKTAIYATYKYGGGFLAVESKENRYFMTQDPNRNFSKSMQNIKSCKEQKYPSTNYTQSVFDIIDTFKPNNYPYLTLHNNTNGGGVSMLRKSKGVVNYPAHRKISKLTRGLSDEDSLVYMAGYAKNLKISRLKPFLYNGLNVKYEVVSKLRNDCSFSNYVVLSNKGEYYNIESEHGDIKTQKIMVDKVMNILAETLRK